VTIVKAEAALSLNENLFEIEYNGKSLDLTPREYDLLAVLMQESQRVVGRAELLRRVWMEGKPLIRVVDTYICRLRAKLQNAGHPGIGVARKRGYRLKASTGNESSVAI
jgi:DNA-binding response OmpR family regulator